MLCTQRLSTFKITSDKSVLPKYTEPLTKSWLFERYVICAQRLGRIYLEKKSGDQSHARRR
jgi:hypothetical protein